MDWSATVGLRVGTSASSRIRYGAFGCVCEHTALRDQFAIGFVKNAIDRERFAARVRIRDAFGKLIEQGREDVAVEVVRNREGRCADQELACERVGTLGLLS
jgi:hypothetical protein